MLTSADMVYLRQSLTELLPDKCVILRSSSMIDGAGNEVQTWGTVAAGVPCRMDSNAYLKDAEKILGGALEALSFYTLTVPYDTDIAETDRVEIGAEVYNVKSLDADKSWMATLRAIVAR